MWPDCIDAIELRADVQIVVTVSWYPSVGTDDWLLGGSFNQFTNKKALIQTLIVLYVVVHAVSIKMETENSKCNSVWPSVHLCQPSKEVAYRRTQK